MFNKVKIEDLQARIEELEAENLKLAQLGTRSVLDLEAEKAELETSVSGLKAQLTQLAAELADKRAEIVETDDQAILQEAGFYQFSTVLDTAVAYAERNSALRARIKTANRAGGNAVLGTTNWTVNGSKGAGQKMVNEVSKLMLRAYNGEVDDSVRTLKPYKLPAAIDRLNKVRASIERLGKSMSIVINPQYHELRLQELRLTADFLEKQAQEKEAEKVKRDQMKEEAQAQRELAAAKAKLLKELAHHETMLAQARENGDAEAIASATAKIAEIGASIQSVEEHAANIRTGYVYVISNIGSFGENVVKIGLTRRLDYDERIRELSSASVPFIFDTHAVVFSTDAVSLEHQLHNAFEGDRINRVNARKEFFRTTPAQVVGQLEKLTETLSENHVMVFNEIPEAVEWRISQKAQDAVDVPQPSA
jgi:DNA repair exonuclease SbcCD ATPase subunit